MVENKDYICVILSFSNRNFKYCYRERRYIKVSSFKINPPIEEGEGKEEIFSSFHLSLGPQSSHTNLVLQDAIAYM